MQSVEAWQAFIYGVVQGLTEFLPVSSSGHLALLPHWFGIEDPGTYFDLMMHLGTTFALLFYFRKRILELTLKLPRFLTFKKEVWLSPDQSDKDIFFLKNFIFSTFCSLILILALKDLAFLYGRNIPAIASNLVIFGLLMWAADWWGKNKYEDTTFMTSKWDFKKAGLIGLAQAIAIFPGVSRSGILLTTCRGLGLSRTEATEYTFFLSIPIILLGCLAKIAETATLYFVDDSPAMPMSDMIITWGVGITTSFVVGVLTIHYFLKLVKRIGLHYFAFYRIIFAAILFLELRSVSNLIID